MRILMICPMISSSSFITTYPFAKILSKKHEVKIIGPLFGKKPYIEDKNLNFEFIEPIIKHPVQLGMLSLISKNLKRVLKDDYDVIHAFKLLPHTVPVGVLGKKFRKKPLIITIDDYDVASPRNPFKKAILSLTERAYKYADTVTVSSLFLQKIYGGEVIYQVANEAAFDRKKHNGKWIRKKYDLEDKIVIIYAGTFYEHKGVDVLIKAIQKLGRKDAKLLLVGNGETEKYKQVAGSETIFVGKIPLEKVPDYVAASDIYAIPTKDTLYARAEIPAKIFEAMMMEKAIVASDISDNSIFLDNGGCGVLVKPGSIDSLKNGILQLIEDPNLRKEIGKKARKRYFKEYSYKEIEKKIDKIYSKVIG